MTPRILVWALVAVLWAIAAGADPLDEAMAAYQGLQQGKITFLVRPAGSPQPMPPATLAFQRPDRLHFWCQLPVEADRSDEMHIWLDDKKLWQFSQGQLSSEPALAGLKDVDEKAFLGPAIFVVHLLNGRRQDLPVDAKKSQNERIWLQFPGPDQESTLLILDPKSHLLQEIIAYRGQQEMARASLEHSPQAPSPQELHWSQPPQDKPKL